MDKKVVSLSIHQLGHFWADQIRQTEEESKVRMLQLIKICRELSLEPLGNLFYCGAIQTRTVYPLKMNVGHGTPC